MPKIEMIKVGEQLYPAAITNYSLSMGEKLGMIKGSQLPDLIESTEYLCVIYLSIIGFNKDVKLSFVDFIEQYRPKKEQLIGAYRNLIIASTDVKENDFAKGLIKSTSTKRDKDQKKLKPPKLNLQCVEDRYTLYCLVYGIDHDVFWHSPIPDVERIYENKQAYDGWSNNPKTQ